MKQGEIRWDKSFLTERISRLPAKPMAALEDGLRLVLGL